MSKEVTELRKAGRLEEALARGIELLDAKPDDVFAARALAWVHYAYLKQSASTEQFDLFLEHLRQLNQMAGQLEGEQLLYDQCAWQIGKLVFALRKETHDVPNKLDAIFECIREFEFSRPSEAYSFLFKSFLGHHAEWLHFATFAEWWGFDHFRPEDFQKEEVQGMRMIATAERGYIAYAKRLLEGEGAGMGVAGSVNREKVKELLEQLDQLLRNHPDLQYPAYYKAKLLIALGDKDEVAAVFIPFARSKRNDFWVWEAMADLFAADDDKKVACYCKALSLNTPEEYLVKVRQNFAELLISRGLYQEARNEIGQVIKVRTVKGWKIPDQIRDWTTRAWFAETKEEITNAPLYTRYLGMAEELLFGDLPEELAVVEFVNHDKHIVYFIVNQQRTGSFKYQANLHRKMPKVGDILKVRFDRNENNNFFRVLTISFAPDNTPTEIIREFSGMFNIHPTGDFGFVDQTYIPGDLIRSHTLASGSNIHGKAMLSYNKKKEQWGWKAIRLDL